PFNFKWVYALLVLFLFIYALTWTPISVNQIKFNRFIDMITQLFTPQNGRNWVDYFMYITVIWDPFMETVRTSFAGTFIGAFFAVPVALICANNLIKIRWLNETVKFFLSLV